MKKLKLYTLLSLAALTPLFFIGCDTGSGGQDDDDIADLTDEVVRGLDLAEITANPDGIPGFPFSLSAGETIDFVPDSVGDAPFIDEVPLGRLIAESSGFVRHSGEGATGALYFPVTEPAFRLIFGTVTNEEAQTVSNIESMFLEYSFEHRFTRVEDFIPRLQQIYDSGDSPGSLQHSIVNGGLVSNQSRVVVEAVSSIGMAAVDYPDVGPSARIFRTIELTEITSTNADLDGPNPIITGTYEVTDYWQEIWTDSSEAAVTLAHDPTSGSDIIFTEASTGTFTLNLDALTATP